jgi:hypothetical protein
MRISHYPWAHSWCLNLLAVNARQQIARPPPACTKLQQPPLMRRPHPPYWTHSLECQSLLNHGVESPNLEPYHLCSTSTSVKEASNGDAGRCEKQAEHWRAHWSGGDRGGVVAAAA